MKRASLSRVGILLWTDHKVVLASLTNTSQYQKNEGAPDSTGGTSNYRFDIKIHDDQDELVGELDYADAPDGQGVNVDSALPDVLIITAESVDSDPVQFAYNGVSWDSSSSQCKVGGYDSGSRNMDCGFTC